jgi:hypothetical protein
MNHLSGLKYWSWFILLLLHIFITTSITIPIRQFLDQADQILLNRLYNPIFTVEAPSLESRKNEGSFFLGNVFFTTFNASIAISTTHGGHLQCLYYPDAHPLTPLDGKAVGGHARLRQIHNLPPHQPKFEVPIRLNVEPIVTQYEIKQNGEFLTKRNKDDKNRNNNINNNDQNDQNDKKQYQYYYEKTQYPYTAQFSPYQTGIYDSAFLSTSSELYDYFSPHEIPDVISEVNKNGDNLPWDLMGDVLDHVPNIVRRNIGLQFSIKPTTIQLSQLLNSISPFTIGFIQCKDVMITTDITSLDNGQFVAHLFGYDKTHYAILHSQKFHLKHQNVHFDNNKKEVESEINFTAEIVDYPNVDYFNKGNLRLRAQSILYPPVKLNSTILSPPLPNYDQHIISNVFQNNIQRSYHGTEIEIIVHAIFTIPKTLQQYLSYLEAPYKAHIEVYLPFIKYSNHGEFSIEDLKIEREKTVFRKTLFNEHSNAILDHNYSDVDFTLRPQCLSIIQNGDEHDGDDHDGDNNKNGNQSNRFKKESKKNQNTNQNTNQNVNNDNNNQNSSPFSQIPSIFAHPNEEINQFFNPYSSPTLCEDLTQIGSLGSRTFIITTQFSPAISSIHANLKYSVKYLDIAKHLSWDSIVAKLLTPSTLRYYDILSVNGLPTTSQYTDQFDYTMSIYKESEHFFVFKNFTIFYPIFDNFSKLPLQLQNDIENDEYIQNLTVEQRIEWFKIKYQQEHSGEVVHQQQLPIFGFEFQKFNPNNKNQCNYQARNDFYKIHKTTSKNTFAGDSRGNNLYTNTAVNFQTAPLSSTQFPIPSSLMSMLSPSMQGLLYHKLHNLKMTPHQNNALRGSQLIEWGLTIPTFPLCPVITNEDFNPGHFDGDVAAVIKNGPQQGKNGANGKQSVLNDDKFTIQRMKILLWLECILSLP